MSACSLANSERKGNEANGVADELAREGVPV